jgi:tRNA pseudouridine55 synthase
VLPLVIGRATRLSQFYTRSDKIYEGVVRFGWATDTYDRAGQPVGVQTDVTVDRDRLDLLLDRFRGEFLQTPPQVSAKKVAGKRAYELARSAVAVELAPVKVEVYELTILDVEGPEARLRVHCSGGTYLRSIAHDVGQLLGAGAHLRELRRLASGEFEIANARTIAQLEALAADERLLDALVPAANMLPLFPTVYVDEGAAAAIRNGRDFPVSAFRSNAASEHVKAVNGRGELLAIGRAVLPNVYHPIVVA